MSKMVVLSCDSQLHSGPSVKLFGQNRKVWKLQETQFFQSDSQDDESLNSQDLQLSWRLAFSRDFGPPQKQYTLKGKCSWPSRTVVLLSNSLYNLKSIRIFWFLNVHHDGHPYPCRDVLPFPISATNVDPFCSNNFCHQFPLLSQDRSQIKTMSSPLWPFPREAWSWGGETSGISIVMNGAIVSTEWKAVWGPELLSFADIIFNLRTCSMHSWPSVFC